MVSLLGSGDPQAVETLGNVDGAPLLVLCDHASNRVPEALGDMGLEQRHLEAHIAWDIGARQVTQHLIDMIGGHAILGCYSRLVIDCNRPLSNSSLVPEISDGVSIPANKGLSSSEIGRRVEEIYLPYHYAVVRALTQFKARGVRPFVLGLHSCTPVMKGVCRPWSIGIAHSTVRDVSDKFVRQMKAYGGFQVGDNEPYAIDDDDYTFPAHIVRANLKHVFIELRQDLIADDAGAAEWANILRRGIKDLSLV
ncbi:N-formylglutamate amidohydrolase [Mesorhizobium sp. B4-1-4]|uniref:N-formylglutamate amidohydrolase n=1 Tax=Mesorhizobium sp. B4-1-4 TaxID=2589888 RepID=UPI0015E3FE1B|nr:N-formylglutamate amidohydrolase [Mesorhizobium sp. B4-1-4]UCI31868.1 N-formylglutamate amidohydrolase [Mesorhizobium sp. B4-1-4]